VLHLLPNASVFRHRLPGERAALRQQAKQATSALVFGNEVTLEPHGTDKYGRAIADVLLTDGTHVNRELVAEGWCLRYLKYAPEDVVLAEFEAAVRVAHKGLWADPNPIRPGSGGRRNQ